MGGDIFEKVEKNPLFGFSNWASAHKKFNMNGAFYLYSRLKVRPTINDCKSSVKQKGFEWSILRELKSRGWEFGLHPPIKAKNDLDEFILGKAFIEDKLRSPIFGLRHHYWAFDWEKPYLTYRKLENAGFKYDLSFAWRDYPGFRAGTSMPFNIWDPQRKRGCNIYSVPTSLMDGHVTHWSATNLTPLNRSKKIIEKIISVGGVSVIDWHTESSCNKYHYGWDFQLWLKLMQYFTNRNDVWITTPWELVKYWHARKLECSVQVKG